MAEITIGDLIAALQKYPLEAPAFVWSHDDGGSMREPLLFPFISGSSEHDMGIFSMTLIPAAAEGEDDRYTEGTHRVSDEGYGHLVKRVLKRP